MSQQAQQGFMRLDAAADYLGNGAVEVNMYENEILDALRRESVALQRFNHKRATGHPHRYFEQTAKSQGTFIDPRNMGTQTQNGPTRVERYASIKAIINQTNIGLFDRDVTEQQGQFASVVATDIDDVINGCVTASAEAIWTGTDTSLTTPTTIEYVGLLTQITTNSTLIASGTPIIDSIKTIVAGMLSSKTYKAKPTAIYLNPILADLIDQEAKANHFQLDTMNVAEGVVVEYINTQAGKLPLISDPYIPSSPNGTGTLYGFTDAPTGQTNYYGVIVSEGQIEMPYISGKTDNPNPRLFELGLTGNLNGQFVAVLFDSIIAKGEAYQHAKFCVQR